jgi:Lon protease-like protein
MSEVIPLFPLSSPLFPGIVLPLEIFEDRYRRLVADLVALPPGSPRRMFGVVAIRQGWEVERVAPAEALYDVGCIARVEAVRAKPDGGFRVVTVGTDRFRLLDVLVGNEDDGDPPYLRAEVEWLAGEEEAQEAAAGRDGLVEPAGTALDRPVDDVAAAVARGSLDLLVGGVRDLFSRYVAEVAALRLGWDSGDDEDEDDEPAREDPADDDADRVGARTTELLSAVADDPAALSWLVASAALLTTEDRQALLAVSATRRRLAAESRLLRRELTLLKTLGAVPVPLRDFATPMTVN